MLQASISYNLVEKILLYHLKNGQAIQNVNFFIINISKGPASKLGKVTRDELKFFILIS